MREPNAIDFWRGYALVTIFINHVPGTLYERASLSHATLSDSAELFVFLAGWAISLATWTATGPDAPLRVVLRLASRMVEVYRAQLVITAIALAMIAGVALWTDNPVVLEWHNAGPFFAAPIATTVGWVLLAHQLGYFNILPLYVVLLAGAPLFVVLGRASRIAAFTASFALYLAALVFELNLPNWPVEDVWFFNPFAWQFILVLGFLAAEMVRDGDVLIRTARRAFPLALAIAAGGTGAALFGYLPDPLSLPEPRLLFMFDKTYLSPARLISFLALVVVCVGIYARVRIWMPWLARQSSALGRNSLAVFSVGSVASLAGQLVRFLYGGGFWIDTGIVAAGVGCLIFTAWFAEWRVRVPSAAPSSV